MVKKEHRFLVVDDDPADVMLLQYHLQKIDDFQIDLHSVNDPTQASSEFDSFAPDLVFLDYHMGSLTGLDVFQSLREAGCDKPVILLTGNGSEHIASAAIHEGISEYLPKGSLSAESLQRAITNTLEKHELRETIKEQNLALKDSNHKLTRQNEEIKRWYHMISHELKTPLTIALEYSALIMDGIAGPIPDNLEDFILTINESCLQLKTFMNDLTEIAILDAGKFSVNRKPTKLEKLVTRLIQAMSPMAARKKVRLTHTAPALVRSVQVDATRIKQVITNLVNNALRFAPEDSEIKVTINDKGSMALVSISDTGPGIPHEEAEKIFQRYYQCGEGCDNAKGSGMGLGLHICKEIIQLHDGEIKVDSEPGKGSTFSFTLPWSATLVEKA